MRLGEFFDDAKEEPVGDSGKSGAAPSCADLAADPSIDAAAKLFFQAYAKITDAWQAAGWSMTPRGREIERRWALVWTEEMEDRIESRMQDFRAATRERRGRDRIQALQDVKVGLAWLTREVLAVGAEEVTL